MRIAVRPSILNAVDLGTVEEDHLLGGCVSRKTISKIYIFLAFNLLPVFATTKP
jgi:hypothetical protein